MRFKKHTSIEPEINLIAFIDVLLVILIFLILTTQYSTMSQLPIQLPKAQTSANAVPKPNEELQLQITAQGRMSLQGHWVEAGSLNAHETAPLSQALTQALTTLSQGQSNPTLIISADQNTPHKWVVMALEAAEHAHMAKVAFGIDNDRAPLPH